MGKQFDPIKCKVCGGAHFGTLCTKFISLRVVEPAKAIKRLALPKPDGATVAGSTDRINGHEPDGNGNRDGNSSKGVTAGKTAPKAKKAKAVKKAKPKKRAPAKSKTSNHRKVYLAEKAKERRAAEKMGMDLETYRAFLAKSAPAGQT